MARKPRNYLCNHCNVEFLSTLKDPLCCSYSCSNKYQAQLRKQTIDSTTGLTLSQLYSKRAAIAIRKSGWYGSSKHKKIAAETLTKTLQKSEVKKKLAAAHAARSQKTLNGISPAQKATQKALATKVQRGLVTSIDQKSDFERYKYLVTYFTLKNDLKSLEHFEKRGRAKNSTERYQLDHIYSIFDGFHNNVPPEVIGHIANLRFIPWRENGSKNHKSDCSLKELFARTGNGYFDYYKDNYYEIKKSKCSTDKMNAMRKICVFCGGEFPLGAHTRWHGDKCKNNTHCTLTQF